MTNASTTAPTILDRIEASQANTFEALLLSNREALSLYTKAQKAGDLAQAEHYAGQVKAYSNAMRMFQELTGYVAPAQMVNKLEPANLTVRAALRTPTYRPVVNNRSRRS